MYREFIEVINEGRHSGPFTSKGYYLVYIGADWLRVHPDGECCLNSTWVGCHPEVLQAIIEKCHEKALELNDVR